MATQHRSRLLAGLAVGALALAACGGDDDGGGGSPQDQVADMFIEQMQSEDLQGATLDEDCVREVMSDLSDDDAQAIVDAGPDGDPDIDASAEEIGLAMIDCIDIDLGELDTDG